MVGQPAVPGQRGDKRVCEGTGGEVGDLAQPGMHRSQQYRPGEERAPWQMEDPWLRAHRAERHLDDLLATESLRTPDHQRAVLFAGQHIHTDLRDLVRVDRVGPRLTVAGDPG